MKPPLVIVILTAGTALGCPGESQHGRGDRDTEPTPGDVSDRDDAAGAEDTTVVDGDDVSLNAEPFHVIAAGSVNVGLTTTSAVCATCHTVDPGATAMRDSAGRDISPIALWQSSMKANSARDPFFRATLSAERARLPEYASAIEGKCLTCHAPLATLDARKDGALARVDDLASPTRRGLLGADGVSCTACHGIASERLGEAETWSGQQVYNDDLALYGPHASPFTNPMVNHTGLTPTQGAHVVDSALCGSCHTLITHSLDLDPDDAPDFPEQTPYLEWRNSAFAAPGPELVTCQDCHMPTRDADGQLISTRIARRPPGGDFPQVSPRSPYGRHLFVGGNTLIPEILKRFRDELLPSAPDAAFDATISLARAQLETTTATLTLSGLAVTNGRLVGEVRVDNLAGHKFPSGYPSRRFWLRVQVEDAAGVSLVEVGGWDSQGRIVGADRAPLLSEKAGGPVLAHREEVSGADTVQVWETVLGDAKGQPNIGLMSAVSYLKDNRLLPRGWSPDGFEAARTSPVGVDGDDDFVAGGDTVRLNMPVAESAKRVTVQLAYQVLSARWAAELLVNDTPEVRAFGRMLEVVPPVPVIIGTVSRQL